MKRLLMPAGVETGCAMQGAAANASRITPAILLRCMFTPITQAENRSWCLSGNDTPVTDRRQGGRFLYAVSLWVIVEEFTENP
jgi:hypothetical protein